MNENYINKKNLVTLSTKPFIMAGVVGFEPTQAVLETDVLPLTLYPYKFIHKNYISIKYSNLQDILNKKYWLLMLSLIKFYQLNSYDEKEKIY